MGSPIVHFEIMGGSGNQLEKFYAELLGWRINSNNPMNYGVVDTGGSDGINGGVGPNQDGSERVTVYAQVDPSLQATLDKAEKLGGKTDSSRQPKYPVVRSSRCSLIPPAT